MRKQTLQPLNLSWQVSAKSVPAAAGFCTDPFEANTRTPLLRTPSPAALPPLPEVSKRRGGGTLGHSPRRDLSRRAGPGRARPGWAGPGRAEEPGSRPAAASAPARLPQPPAPPPPGVMEHFPAAGLGQPPGELPGSPALLPGSTQLRTPRPARAPPTRPAGGLPPRCFRVTPALPPGLPAPLSSPPRAPSPRLPRRLERQHGRPSPSPPAGGTWPARRGSRAALRGGGGAAGIGSVRPSVRPLARPPPARGGAAGACVRAAAAAARRREGRAASEGGGRRRCSGLGNRAPSHRAPAAERRERGGGREPPSRGEWSGCRSRRPRGRSGASAATGAGNKLHAAPRLQLQQRWGAQPGASAGQPKRAANPPSVICYFIFVRYLGSLRYVGWHCRDLCLGSDPRLPWLPTVTPTRWVGTHQYSLERTPGSNGNRPFAFLTLCQTQQLHTLLHWVLSGVALNPNRVRIPSQGVIPCLTDEGRCGLLIGIFTRLFFSTAQELQLKEVASSLGTTSALWHCYKRIYWLQENFWVLSSEFKFCLNRGEIYIPQTFNFLI